MGHIIDRHTGIVNLRPKQGDKLKHTSIGKNITEKSAKEIQTCLNCKKESCKGSCKKITDGQ